LSIVSNKQKKKKIEDIFLVVYEGCIAYQRQTNAVQYHLLPLQSTRQDDGQYIMFCGAGNCQG
jgi:hypothetical protein